tara:strand:+ start:289 stop:462 length:174 start_codon:yes stop_codon:yes gene_type:complete
MKFEDAIAKSIKTFMDGKIPENLNKTKEGGIKYTPEYMDAFAEELASSKSKESEDDN